jgi:hypothetical protein
LLITSQQPEEYLPALATFAAARDAVPLQNDAA